MPRTILKVWTWPTAVCVFFASNWHFRPSTSSTASVRADALRRDELCGHKLRDTDTHCTHSKVIQPCKSNSNEQAGEKSVRASTPDYLHQPERKNETRKIAVRVFLTLSELTHRAGGGGAENNNDLRRYRASILEPAAVRVSPCHDTRLSHSSLHCGSDTPLTPAAAAAAAAAALIASCD